MALSVFLLKSAEDDLKDLKQYLSQEFGLTSWRASYKGIKKVIENLAHSPLSGVIPQELISIGQTQYRQVISGMNRIIYEVKLSIHDEEQIYIHVITDVRKDLKSLLIRRLLHSK